MKKGLFVHPKYQGFGIGKALFEKSLELIDKGEIRLVVIENNLRAKTMYEKHGFVASGEDVKAFYSSPQVAMSLRKN
jgi:ribosomal protein S18 acetylase RimI-like enzyme